MLSSTVKTSMSLKCWCTIPMPSLVASLGSFILTTSPFFLMTPSSGWYIPKSTLISVLLPAPFSPRRAWISPFLSWRVMLSLATIPGKRLVMPSISIMYSGCAATAPPPFQRSTLYYNLTSRKKQENYTNSPGPLQKKRGPGGPLFEWLCTGHHTTVMFRLGRTPLRVAVASMLFSSTG